MVPAAILRVLIEAEGVRETHRQLNSIDKQAQKTADSTDKLEKKFSGLDRSVGDFNRTMAGARNVMKLVKFPAMIAGAGMAASAIGALGAGVISLTSALAPAAGAAGALAVAYSAMGQAALVAKLGFKGVSDSMEKATKKLEKPTAAAKQFGKMLAHEVIPQIVILRDAAQKGMLGGMTQAVKTAAPTLSHFAGIVEKTGKTLGGLAKDAAEMFASKAWQKDIHTLGNANVRIIGNLGQAALSAADGARNLLVSAVPLAKWLSKMAVNLGNVISTQIGAARQTGKLAHFFRQTKVVLKELGSILANVGVGIFNIGKASAPLGRSLLRDITKLTKKFREWTESVSGQNQLKDYFAAAKEPIHAAAGLVGDLVGAFLRLSKPNEQATQLFNQLRKMVPILENVIKTTTAALGPALLDAITNLVRLFGQLAGTSGPLTNLVKLIGLLAGGLASLLENSPAVNHMTVSMIGLYGVMKPMMLLFGPLAKGAKALQVALIGETAAAETAGLMNFRMRVQLVAAAIAMKAQRAAAIALTAAQWLWNAAMTANPIGIVIAAIAAMVAAVIVAYKNWTTFRKVVDAVWAWMKKAAIDAFGWVTKAVTDCWKAVSSATKATWNALKPYLKGVWTVIKTVVDTWWNSIGKAITFPIRLAIAAIKTLLGKDKGGLRDFLGETWSDIKKIFTGAKDGLVSVITAPFRAAVTAIGKFAKLILKVVDKIPGVDMGGPIASVDKFIKANGLARGGAFARTGGYVDSPITLMGEEAPRHPEFVIPTNPQYRKRAKSLLSQAAGAIGFAEGGVNQYNKTYPGHSLNNAAGHVRFTAQIVKSIAESVGLPGTPFEQIAHGESQYYPGVISGDGGYGLWQMTPRVWGSAAKMMMARLGGVGAMLNPLKNATMAKYLFDNAGGVSPWFGTQYLTSSPTPSGGGGFPNPIEMIKDLIGKLPKPDLPDWLGGLGSWMLDQGKNAIKSLVPDITLPSFSNAAVNGLQPQVMHALAWARAHGWRGTVTSGLRSREKQQYLWDHAAQLGLVRGVSVAAPGTSMHERGLAVDVTDVPGFQRAMESAPSGSKLFWRGASDPVHFSTTGHATGGVYGGMPYVGKFHNGGVASAEGMAWVDKGERMTPAGGGNAPIVHIENATFSGRRGADQFASKLAWQLQTR